MAPTILFRPDQIKELREGLGLTQQEFADRIGVAKQSVSSWENGVAEPSITSLLRIVNTCGAKLGSFFAADAPAEAAAGDRG